jgi:HSP20 family protein
VPSAREEHEIPILFGGTAMTVMRWSPFSDLNALQARVNRLFDEIGHSDETNTTLWTPMADIYENQDNLVLKVELPGMDQNNIDLRLENNVLTIRGSRNFDNEVKAENYHRGERSYGTFSRSFSLPVVVDQEKIAADYKDGILKITLPKKEQAKAKRIQISAA